MNRRLFLAGAVSAAVSTTLATRAVTAATETKSMTAAFPPLDKTNDEWKQLLADQAYQVLFEEATERPWTSPLNDEKRDGTYVCAACYLPLFESKTKFDSGTGWPSFYQPIEGSTGTKKDWKMLIPRTEYHCARCGGHQGHVFNDGPQPTGQRWCNNGVALRFVPEAENLPELRV
jgi:peptide-methionine (R)-S-oxide reductase